MPIELARTVLFEFGGMLYAFGDDHDRITLARGFALGDVLAYALDGERNFRNQNHVGASGDAGFERDPSTVAAHDLDHHDAVMRFTGSVDLVDGVGDGVQRGIESEGDFSGGKIVVDSFGYAHDLESLEKKIVADFFVSRRRQW